MTYEQAGNELKAYYERACKYYNDDLLTLDAKKYEICRAALMKMRDLEVEIKGDKDVNKEADRQNKNKTKIENEEE